MSFPRESIVNLPKKYTKGNQIRPRGASRNPIKEAQDREWRRTQQAVRDAQALAATPPPTGRTGTSARHQCPNPDCKNPNVVDGTCRTCGRVADDSNIVAEISFGENAQGAAVVQGSFIAADQGSFRPPTHGIGQRRAAGNGSADARDRALREARQIISGFAYGIHASEHTANVATQLYKVASSTHFVQGRKISTVAAVCLYAACRKQENCRILLIDLADIIKEDVFYLGRVYKKLITDVPGAKPENYTPILIEDLIQRFALKLEFGTMTTTVAETAVRLLARMRHDWMVSGRRPAGICGACLIMAARMCNFRRTVREVVYIAKVTMATLQLRLDEFKELPSAKMTVEEFLGQELLPDAEQFDPPAVYKKREDYQARLKKERQEAKRKRTADDDGENDKSGAQEAGKARKRPKKSKPKPSKGAEPRTDGDGFVIPPLPHNASQTTDSGDRAIIEQALETEKAQEDQEDAEDAQLDILANEYGDGPQSPEDEDEDGEDDAQEQNTTKQPSQPIAAKGSSASATESSKPAKSDARGAKASSDSDPPLRLDDDWEEDEDILEMEIMGTLNAQRNVEDDEAFQVIEERAAKKVREMDDETRAQMEAYPHRPVVSDNPEIGEDEFADDPEVMYCLLPEADQKNRERIWLNLNESYLREQQKKEFRARTAPPKQTRRRRKQSARMGEGQKTPASTPGEAAVQVMDTRKFSNKINYEAIKGLFNASARRGPGSVISDLTSRQTSRAGSTVGSGDDYQGRQNQERTAHGEDEDMAEESDEDDRPMYDEEDPGEDYDPLTTEGGDNDEGY